MALVYDLHTADAMVNENAMVSPAEHADFCGTEHMDIKDKAVVTTKRDRAQNLANKDNADCTDHIDKCAKETPRPYLTRKILYTEDLWTEWALQPFDLSLLIARRNKDGNMFIIHVASIYEADGVSGFGYIIRDCHGTPIVAYSQYLDTKEIGPVSESYLELKAVDKSLEHAEKLALKHVSMVSTSCEVYFAVDDCYREEVSGMCIDGKQDDKVTDVCVDIIKKLKRRHPNEEENHFYFHIHPETYERSLNAAVCLVGLQASGTVPELLFEFDKGQQKMPLAIDKLSELLKLLHTDASTPSLFHP